MRKMFLCLLLICSFFTACSEDNTPDEYKGLKLYKSESGISLYMANGYKETSADGVMCAYDGDGAVDGTAVSCREETFASLEAYGYKGLSLEEYTELLINANGAASEYHNDEYGNIYFIYEQTIMDIPMTYYGFVDMGTDSFVVTNFICPTETASEFEADFKLWASSIVIE